MTIPRATAVVGSNNETNIEIRTLDPLGPTFVAEETIGSFGVPFGDEEPPVVMDYIDDGNGVRIIVTPPLQQVVAPHTLLDDGSILGLRSDVLPKCRDMMRRAA